MNQGQAQTFPKFAVPSKDEVLPGDLELMTITAIAIIFVFFYGLYLVISKTIAGLYWFLKSIPPFVRSLLPARE